MQPLVAIILVNYNGFDDTVECVKSLKNIDYDNYKIIVVDNGSTVTPTDEQISYLSDNTIYIVNEINSGFAGGNNTGIKYAKSIEPDFYLLINNDTVADRYFLSNLVEVSRMYTNAGIICGKIYWFDEPKRLWYAGGAINRKTCVTTHYHYNEIDSFIEDNREVTFATGCLWLLPKNTIDFVGLLAEEYFLYAEDDDYCCRVADAGLKIIYCPKAIIFHKVSKSTGAKSKNTQYYIIRNRVMMINKYSSNKLRAYYQFVKENFKKILKNEVDVMVFIESIKDVMRGKKGRR